MPCWRATECSDWTLSQGAPRPQADPGWKVRRLAMIKRHARRRSLGSEQELEDDLAG